MSIIDRIRALFGGKQSGAEQTAVAGGAVVAATSGDDPGDVEPHSGSADFGGGGDSGGGGGDGGGNGGANSGSA